MDSARLSNRMESTAVAGRIKSARIALGLSQGVLATRLGVHRATIAHWERDGGFVPSVENLRALSHELKVGFEWLAVGSAISGQPVSSPIPDSRRRLESRMADAVAPCTGLIPGDSDRRVGKRFGLSGIVGDPD
ncbi:helix-turn-helix transcriptional regulator [Xanthomonas axonopodis pv. phyllanthi]|uniref:helix-turn-helix transcriptional regulator n=1 Tax=Xanthomonas axonopodis TaxID=53413 RepID=UPI0035583CCE